MKTSTFHFSSTLHHNFPEYQDSERMDRNTKSEKDGQKGAKGRKLREWKRFVMEDVIGIFLDVLLWASERMDRNTRAEQDDYHLPAFNNNQEGSLPSLSSSRVCADRCCRQCNPRF
ncbi:hypothetical protein CEXT_569561 [Caerostris extrusa]|uniref:Uncharacterized protein n=1 Tax=Caerostris extrusa TaxID=172846 RepID=A0AAV4RJR1_CAEEX|nr:hypothetical protein CEXT_569561 [Caerostris extrusa]